MSVNNIIGKCLLLNLLNHNHMTQVDLSVKTGIAKTQINEYIAGTRKMSLANAYVISRALRCHIEDLYDWKVK